MISFPNCKINLGLYITNKRADGYHDLQTIFYPLPFYDVLEIIQEDVQSSRNQEALQPGIYQTEGLTFFSGGLTLPGNPHENICIKAWQLVKKDFPELPPISMYLYKNIPAGAGLGGGSADGTYCLMLLNEKFQLGITNEKLAEYAMQLGSDCPFFIYNQPAIAGGRGEILEPVMLNLSEYKFVLVNPGVHINTTEAFSGVVPKKPVTDLKTITTLQPPEWKQLLYNQFEETIFQKYPQLAGIKETLYEYGATYASMTGTGATIFGIYHKEHKTEFNFPADWLVKILPCCE